MKKIYHTLLLFAIAILNCISTHAQTEVNVSPNDSLSLELDGYKRGEILWQRSTNGTTWSKVIAANPETMSYKITVPAYFRSQITDGTCNIVASDTIQANMLYPFSIPAGRGYAESDPYVTSSGIGMEEKGILNNWTDNTKKAVWFLYQRAGTYIVSFNLYGTNAKTYNFQMNTSPAYDGLDYTPESFDFSYTGKGSTKVETMEFFTVTIPKTGYYRYELSGSTSMTGLTINTLLFDGVRTPKTASIPEAHTTNYLSSPSVHLGFNSTKSTTKNYEWLYEEILVPDGFDPLSSYYMSIGFFRGYMGIQTNSATERRVLFSVWDVVDKDKWPDAPKEVLVSLVDKAPYTQANAFGGEGTGGQSYVGRRDINTWKTGTPVKFLMNCRRDGGIIAEETISGVVTKGDSIKHSIISAWYDAGSGWRYIASWRTPSVPGGKTMFDGFHSFLENYGWKYGQSVRKAYYYNTYAKETNGGNWVHLNLASYSNTDGGTGQRIDFEQGVAPEDPTKFYMLSGGYGKTVKTPTKSVPYVDIVNFPYLRDLDLSQFSDRVDEALQREIEWKEILEKLQYKDKTGWQVLYYSSQETSGEGSNGRAAQIIDGNDATYWHSKWSGGAASYPHRFVIDMGKDESIKGFRILSSDGDRRWPKNIVIEASETALPLNSNDWSNNVILDTEASNSVENVLFLDTQKTFRYFRFSVINGQNDDDGSHIRINEISPFTYE